MPHRIVLVGLALAAGMAPAFASDGISGSAFKSGNWEGGAYAENGAFTHCAMSVPYRSGIRLHFAIDRDYHWRLGMSHEGWAMREGDTFKAGYQVDRHQGYASEARVLSPTFLLAELEATDEVFNQFRRGRNLYVSVGDQSYSFTLTGTSRALSRTMRCVNTYLDHREPAAPPPGEPAPPTAFDNTVGGRMPTLDPPEALPPAMPHRSAAVDPPAPSGPDALDDFATSPLIPVLDPPQAPEAQPAAPSFADDGTAPEQPPQVALVEVETRGSETVPGPAARAAGPALATTPQDVLDATRFAMTLFSAPDLADYRLSDPRAMKSDAIGEILSSAVAWTAPNGGEGALHVYAAAATTPDDIIAEMIAADARRCDSAFASGKKPADANPAVATAFAACKSGETHRFYVDYLAFARGGDRVYLLTSAQPRDAGIDQGVADMLARHVTAAMER